MKKRAKSTEIVPADKVDVPARARRTNITWKEKFLADLVVNGNVTTACAMANVSRQTAYEWRERDREFAVLWDSALEQATDALEREARRRALEGWEEPVFGEDGEKGRVRRYSDRLMEILLKAHRPAKFRERMTVEHEIGEGLAKRLEQARRRVK